MLYYREAERRERRLRARRIVDQNAAFTGGERANDLVKELDQD